MSDSRWRKDPSSGEWNTAQNWTPDEVPTDTADFEASDETDVTFSQTSEATVGAIVFAAGAPSYAFSFTADTPPQPQLTITGEGIANDSAQRQSFVIRAYSKSFQNPQLKFTSSASAGGPDVSYDLGPATPGGPAGGAIQFCDDSTAGSASFTVRTGEAKPPKDGAVGAEVGFSDRSTAGTARFTIYGTTGKDGDTFGNAAFHDHSTADRAQFTNAGGTVSKGDGGNTQFYDHATAARGLFYNQGGIHEKANGGDVAFDGTSTAGHGHFHNYASTVANAYGGVTSFNNNAPDTSGTTAASAGQGVFVTYGAREDPEAGGGHVEFSGKYGSGTADRGTFYNMGTSVASSHSSSAGHTVFSISVPQETTYRPTAGHGTFVNLPGTVEGAAAGYTEFTVYVNDDARDGASEAEHDLPPGPTADHATFINQGSSLPNTAGGYTSFGETSSAANARLIATGGTGGGQGGSILFKEKASGDEATVQLSGNGELDVSGSHYRSLDLGGLDLTGGIIKTELGRYLTGIALSRDLVLRSPTTFQFEAGDGFEHDTPYVLLTASNLSDFSPDQFRGNSLRGVEPTFTIVDDELRVSFDR